jgi:uncharacterized protein (TIGR02266 family)
MSGDWAAVAELAASLDTRSYYEVLGVDRDVDARELPAAYARRVHQYHPDRHAREVDPERRRMLVSIQARLNEAYRALSDARRRAAYDEALAAGEHRLAGRAPKRETSPRTARARLYYELGQDRERAGDRAGARVQYRLAIQVEPGSPAIEDALARVEAAAAPAATGPAARRDTRHPYPRPVRLKVRSWDQLITLHARNVSRGGIFVRATTPMPPGSRAELVLALPDGRQLMLEAEVARVVPEGGPEPAGMGLRFLPMDDERRAQFEVLLQEAASFAAGFAPARPAPTPRPEGSARAIPTRRLLEEDLFTDRVEVPTETAPPDVTLSTARLAAEGRAALKTGRYRDARAKLAEAIRLDPRDRFLRAAFHLASGHDERAEGRDAEALEHFHTALVFDKACEEAIRELRGAGRQPTVRGDLGSGSGTVRLDRISRGVR